MTNSTGSLDWYDSATKVSIRIDDPIATELMRENEKMEEINMQDKEMKELIAKQKEIEVKKSKLDDVIKEDEIETQKLITYLKDQLDKRSAYLKEIEKITERLIKPRKEEISQLEASITRIMSAANMKKIKGSYHSVTKTPGMKIIITDKEKALQFGLKNPDIVKADIFKSAEIDKLIDQGVGPDPDEHGIDTSTTYSKYSYKKGS